ncbi:MAG: 50S ribosomal protein L9 [Vicinamibacterales bacterium]
MEVILREHVEHLGKRGEIVKVAPGYARNFLLPRKLALAVTAANKRQVERERASAEARESQDREQAQAVATRMEQIEIVIARRAGEGDMLYGSVTSADIAESLAAQGFEVDKRKIQLAEPIRSITETSVPIRLHRDVVANVKVKVVPQ